MKILEIFENKLRYKNYSQNTIKTYKQTLYKVAKEDYIRHVANKWKNQITEECYQALLNYKIEIID